MTYRFCIALLLMIPFGGMAQAEDPLPPGPYRTSCSSATYNSGVLKAWCKTGEYGGPKNLTNLSTFNCADGTIFNQRGQLMCYAKNRENAIGFAVWPGSYLRSCKWVSMDFSRLTASCSRGKGRYIQTTLDTKSCDWGSDISNNKGSLVC